MSRFRATAASSRSSMRQGGGEGEGGKGERERGREGEREIGREAERETGRGRVCVCVQVWEGGRQRESEGD